MFNTKNIKTTSKYQNKVDPIKEVFNLWLTLSPEDKIKLSELKIKWYSNKNG